MKKLLRFITRWLYRLVYLALSLLLLLAVLSMFSKAINPEKILPGILGYARLVVISGSMQPAIDPGDLLIIKEQESYEPGDIITFLDGQSLITHRLLAVREDFAITRGDANNTDDAPVPMENIQGRMVLRIPRLGQAILWLKTSQGILALTGLLVLIIAVNVIFRGGIKTPEQEKKGEDAPHET